MASFASIRAWAKRIKRDTVMLWFARRHPDTPVLAKLFCMLTIAYALSPIDLVPDFIPVLGYVDDVLLVPAFIWLAVRMLPPHVVAQCRVEADAWMTKAGAKPKSYLGAVAIVAIWIAVSWLGWQWYLHT